MKKIISIAFALLFIFGFSFVGSATEGYYVGDVTINESSDASGTGWKWSSANKILTLENANIITTNETALLLPNEVTVVVSGTNKISAQMAGISIFNRGSLKIKGNGVLQLTGYICCYETFTVDTSVKISLASYYSGIHCKKFIANKDSELKIVLEAGMVEMAAYETGIYCDDFTQNGGTIDIIAKPSSDLISSGDDYCAAAGIIAKNIVLNDGTLCIEATAKDNHGIMADKLTVNGGSTKVKNLINQESPCSALTVQNIIIGTNIKFSGKNNKVGQVINSIKYNGDVLIDANGNVLNEIEFAKVAAPVLSSKPNEVKTESKVESKINNVESSKNQATSTENLKTETSDISSALTDSEDDDTLNSDITSSKETVGTEKDKKPLNKIFLIIGIVASVATLSAGGYILVAKHFKKS